MRKIRVLVVDESIVCRKLLAEVLSSAEDVEVVATAPDGPVALGKIEQFAPDVITLDAETSGERRSQTLIVIKQRFPSLPVVMFSALTETDAAATLEALALGASDYVTKPSGDASKEVSIEHVRSQLLPKVRALGASFMASGALPSATPIGKARTAASPKPTQVSGHASRIELIAIGTSTGGPNALATLFSALPKDFAVPVVCVQHMPPLFTKLLAERLGASSPLQFHEAQGGETLAPGHVYIAKGDHHLRVVREGNEAKLVLDRGPAENSCRPAVDVLFRSAATAFGAGTLAVVMTGMGQDGLVGSKSVREHGGHIIAQDEASSIVWGMPGFVAKAGLAEAILPLSQIGPYIARKLEQQTALVRRPQAVAARR